MHIYVTLEKAGIQSSHRKENLYKLILKLATNKPLSQSPLFYRTSFNIYQEKEVSPKFFLKQDTPLYQINRI